jgi:hypothetical protein
MHGYRSGIPQAVPNLRQIEINEIVGPYGNRTQYYFHDSRLCGFDRCGDHRPKDQTAAQVSACLSAIKALSTIEIVTWDKLDFKITGEAKLGDMIEIAREVFRKADHKEAKCIRVIIRKFPPGHRRTTSHAQDTVERVDIY